MLARQAHAVPFAACALLLLSFAPLAAAEDDPILEQGRADTKRFFDGELESLYEDFDATMKAAITLEALTDLRNTLVEQLGDQRSLLDEKVVEQGGVKVYVRIASFEKSEAGQQIVFAYSSQAKIAGFFVRPQQTEAPSEYLDYQTRTPLSLPFVDEWQVFWGGRSIQDNYHTAYRDQRFAYDFLIVRDGSSFTGDGTKNEQYHCFDLEIVAPGDGLVVSAANDVEDNVPGEMNAKQPLGNHVILDHGNGEYSFLAHFRKGTLRVKEGDRVTRGQPLARSGNSGHSSEAHLHYHLQTTDRFNDGDGLPSFFLNYVADGKSVERGEPARGQRLRPAAPAKPASDD